MGLLPPRRHIVGGSIQLEGRELVGLPERELRKLRGNEIAMIFQDSDDVAEPDEDDRQAGRRARADPPRRLQGGGPRPRAEVLELVGLPRPSERLDDYPHQLSGGLRQRVMIAMALACEPKLLIADEPTTALDVTIQAQILACSTSSRSAWAWRSMLVTHDMGVVAGRADRVIVMYAGRMVETATAVELFGHMRHPYTQALLGSIPRMTRTPAGRSSASPGCRPTSPTRRLAAASRRAAIAQRPVPRGGAAAAR